MKKLWIILGIGGLGVVALCGLVSALTSAAASLANGVAMASMASAVQTAQCTAAFVALIALAGGTVLGIGVGGWRTRREIAGRMTPRGERARLQNLPISTLTALSHSAPQLPNSQDGAYFDDPDEEVANDDLVFENWKW